MAAASPRTGQTWEPIGQTQPPAQPAKKKRGWLKWGVIAAVGLLFLSVAMNGLGGDSASEEPVAEAEAAVEAAVTATETADALATSEQPNAPSEETESAPDMTLAQENALRSAESYLEFAGFSRQGLIDQLSSEYGDQFTVEQATFAADTLGL
jgi:hypothetical protein